MFFLVKCQYFLSSVQQSFQKMEACYKHRSSPSRLLLEQARAAAAVAAAAASPATNLIPTSISAALQNSQVRFLFLYNDIFLKDNLLCT